MFKIIVDPLSDNSLKGRLELFHLGMGNLRNSIFTGKFIGEWWNNEAAGGYIHNWLSFLSAYGLIPFIFFIFLIIYLFFLGFVSYNKSGNLLPLILLLFATIAIITSRSYVWPFIWFVLGFSSSYRVGGFNNEDSVPISLE
jgi:O-antigen ligase